MSETEEPTAAGSEDAAGGGSANSQGSRPAVDQTVCLCAGLGPLLTQTLRTLTVPEEVKRTVHETEREALRLLRTLIEMRLSTLGDNPGGATAGDSRGTKIDVE